MITRSLILGTACLAAGCTGLSLGENEPGGDTPVDPDPPEPGEHRMGAIAVEPDEDQLWAVHEENRRGELRANLSAIDPETGATYEVMDVSGMNDRRVVFPGDDRMILFAETGGRDHLVLFDTVSRRVLTSREAPTWYWGTRTAPSGRAVVVADNVDPLAPLHVIDTATLEHQVLEHGGDAVEAMWNHDEDILLALSVTDPFGAEPTARLLRYDLRAADFSAGLPAPTVAWELGGYGWDYWFSYTWIGISPDDRWAVFPLIKRTGGPDDGEHVLLVLDQATGGVDLVEGRGPVGFTNDSARIVSYGMRDDGGQDLWLIDPVSHERNVVTMPFTAGVSFIVSRDTDHIVCDPVGGGSLAVYDVATDQVRELETSSLDLWDYVTRRGTDELWLETGGTIRVLSMTEPALDTVSMGGALTRNINVRPSADQAVTADATRAVIRRIDMASRTIAGDPIELPSPFDYVAPSTVAPARVRAPASAVQSPFDPQYRPDAPRRAPVEVAR